MESFIISETGGKLLNVTLHDEILLQLFRQCNREQVKHKGYHNQEEKDKGLHNSVLMFLIVSRYCTPSEDLKETLIRNCVNSFGVYFN
jgi:hypothetical protein